MHVELTDVDAQYIKNSVKNGYFRSEAEAVRDAVRRARERHEERQARLLEALRRGEEDIAAGRVTPYAPGFMEERRENARRMLAEGGKPDPDAVP